MIEFRESYRTAWIFAHNKRLRIRIISIDAINGNRARPIEEGWIVDSGYADCFTINEDFKTYRDIPIQCMEFLKTGIFTPFQKDPNAIYA